MTGFVVGKLEIHLSALFFASLGTVQDHQGQNFDSPKDNGNKCNPAHSRQSNNSTHETQVEWPFLERLRIDEANEDRNAIRDIEPDGGDGGSRREGDG